MGFSKKQCIIETGSSFIINFDMFRLSLNFTSQIDYS